MARTKKAAVEGPGGRAGGRRRGRPPGSGRAAKALGADLSHDLNSGATSPSPPQVNAAEANVARARANLRAIGVTDWDPERGRLERVGSGVLHLWKGLRRPPSLKEISMASGYSEDAVIATLSELEDEGKIIVLDGPIYVPVVLKH